jgi:hypothetical protein
MNMQSRIIIRWALFIVFSLLFYRFRWGILGLTNFGPPKQACSDIEVLNTYLRTGGSPSAYLGRKPLIVCATEAGSYEGVAKLLDLGVNVDAPIVPIPLPIMFEDIGTTALYAAVYQDHLEIANGRSQRLGEVCNKKRARDNSPCTRNKKM